MGLLEIELAKLDYAERLQSAERTRHVRRRADTLPRTAGARTAGLTPAGLPEPRTAGTVGRTRRAKVDAPVFTVRIGGFRYRLWFTRTVAL
ncbi:hypothetical protein [Arthrobacter koreensis]|uniref:hypothetical protein n=1 Tax=Arthrobacter koreensis TaxID=199136 RepID=UPI000A90FE85|nr:hypothetical protein [Arthrobacter koreensis]